jgi:hypothetical protein
VGPLNGWDAREHTAAARTRVHAGLLGPPEAPTAVGVHGGPTELARIVRPLLK